MPFRRALPDALRLRAERCFGVDFAAVRLERGTAARRETEALGSIACAVEGRILLHPEARITASVLAHELAHLAQPRADNTDADAEAEAHRGAAALLAGRRMTLRAGVRRGAALGWNEPGHYYTVYVLALAAGFPADLAYRVALYCQLPDFAAEFDAGVAGVPQVREIPVVGQIARVGAFIAPVVGKVNSSVDALGRFAAQADDPALFHLAPEMLPHIQRGLHAFTGRLGGVETKFRCGIIERLTPAGMEVVDYGLALHALGDSFAHRNGEGEMCQIPFGHAAQGPDIDDIGPNSAKVYLSYVTTLHESLLATAKRQGFTARCGYDGVLRGGIENMTRTAYNRAEQIVRFRNIATQIGQSMEAFEPNNDNLAPFRSWIGRTGAAQLNGTVFLRAVDCARRWSLADAAS